MTQFFYRFTKGGGSTVVQSSVLACSVGGFDEEVANGLLMSADDIYIYIYMYLSLACRLWGCCRSVA